MSKFFIYCAVFCVCVLNTHAQNKGFNEQPILSFDLDGEVKRIEKVIQFNPQEQQSPPVYTARCPSAIVSPSLVAIGAINNPPRPYNAGNDHGSVPYVYSIGRFEITNQEYAAFLNAIASINDPHNTFHNEMMTTSAGGIARFQMPNGRFCYVPRDRMNDKPVNFVTWKNAARFVNWLENHQPQNEIQRAGTTETGVYDLTQQWSYINASRTTGTRWFIPNGNEWVKAAYYSPSNQVWFNFATGSNTEPAFSGANEWGQLMSGGPRVVNYNAFELPAGPWTHFLTSVGSATSSPSPMNTFDMNGNVREFVEQIVCIGPYCGRVARGGDFTSSVYRDYGAYYRENGLYVNLIVSIDPDDPSYDPGEVYVDQGLGFRVGWRP